GEVVVDGALTTKIVQPGDLVVITACVPVGRSGTTNLIKIHHIGQIVAKGQGIGTQVATGKVVVAQNPREAIEKTKPGTVLVCPGTDKDYIPAFEKAAAVITEAGGITSHAAIVGLNLGKPVIVGVENAMSLLQDEDEVTVYAELGIVFNAEAN